MDTAPGMLFRRKPVLDVEDLALSFMEEEVGRFDWLSNWKTIKESGGALQRVDSWLKALGIDHDAKEIVDWLDQMAASKTGRWR